VVMVVDRLDCKVVPPGLERVGLVMGFDGFDGSSTQLFFLPPSLPVATLSRDSSRVIRPRKEVSVG
jgi:hypothetical protein